MEAMAMGHSVPIYRRDRSNSSHTGRRPLHLKAPKLRTRKKKARRGSDTSQSDGAIAISPAGEWLDETASTISLPPPGPPPPPPVSPDEQESPLLPPHRPAPRMRSFSTLRSNKSRGLRKMASTDSLSDTPFTDLVASMGKNGKRSRATPDAAIHTPTGPILDNSQTPLTPPVPAANPAHLFSPRARQNSDSADYWHFHASLASPSHANGAFLRLVKPSTPLADTFQSAAAGQRGRSPSLASNPLATPPIASATMNQSFSSQPSTGTAVPASGASLNPQATYQHILEMTQKRVSTLDYLRKTHEGRVYWYNTLLYSRTDLLRLPSFSPTRLARRATNFLLLGLSLPAILDINASAPLDFLRVLNSVLAEFEAYQSIHPPDGSASSSLSRARIPRFFRTTASTGGRGRRASSAADIGAPLGAEGGVAGGGGGVNGLSSGSSTNLALTGSSTFGGAEQELLPGEEYSHLLTPSLPFDPDFFEVFATLCEVLIETYMRISKLVDGPAAVVPGVAETFAKADARLRKVIVAGVIKEFEEATRAGVKGEVRGIGRVVLGGLM